jgi:Tol biopolymer transport system component
LRPPPAATFIRSTAMARISRAYRGALIPAWSPDGKQITFARWDNVAPGIYIANADGSNEQLVFGTPRARWPQWSPDGKFIVFAQDKSKDDRTIIWKLGVVELATGKLTEPQCTQLCFVPSWGPDSTTIAFTDPGVGIQTTSRTGGAASLVLGPTGMYWDASKNAALPILYMPPIQNSEWSSDGRRIVYSQKAHDRWELNVVNADGSNQVAVTKPDPILTLFFNSGQSQRRTHVVAGQSANLVPLGSQWQVGIFRYRSCRFDYSSPQECNRSGRGEIHL